MRGGAAGQGILLAAALLAAGTAHADKVYKDARDRFRLTLPTGWELTPMPGDTEGMVFRRRVGDVPGILSVKVAPATPSDTHTSVMDARTRSFQRELGYDRQTELEVKVANLKALRRTHTVFLNGDENIKRYAVDHVVFAYGYAHYVHFETADGHYPSFTKDLQALLASYQPLAGRKLYEPLIGRWQMVGGPAGDGGALTLNADQFFQLGTRSGLWRADGKRLMLTEPLGTETFRYIVDDQVLTLQSDTLKEPVSYRRAAGGPKVAEDDDVARARANRALKMSQEQVVGSWMVVEGGDSFEMSLTESGAFRFGPMGGRYELKGNMLSVESNSGVRVTYYLTFDGKRLRMSGGDLDRPLVLERRQ
ncbi:MAG: hypothetical protein HY904_11120 [Deltaproteobacteria bacterium]|nr:hypothetical protein [Deltaproteobacteria bacterium]